MTATSQAISLESMEVGHSEPAALDGFSLNVSLVAKISAVGGVLYLLTDHDWIISRYEDFAAGSEFMEAATAEGNPLRRIAIFAMGALGLIVLLRRSGYRLGIRNMMSLLMLAAAGWCLASWFWSIEPSIAARRLVSSGCEAVTALALAKLLKPRELALAVLFCSIGFLLVGVVAELSLGTFQPWRADYRFAGTLHPNSQGLNCAAIVMAATYFIERTPGRRLRYWLAAALGIIGLWFTRSRTPLAALVIAEFVIWFLTATRRQKLIGSLAVLALASLAILVAGDGIFERISEGVMMGRNDEEQTSSLTGRVPLWEELEESISRRPLTGYGFSSFWVPRNIEDVSDSQSWAVSVAHSTYLDLALGMGLIGAGLCILVVIGGVCRAILLHFRAPTVGFDFIGVILVFALLHGTLESAFANPGYLPLVELAGLAMLGFVDPRQYFTERLKGAVAA
jgi:O-antigen ligase